MLQAMYPSYGNLAFDYTFEASDYFSAFGRSVAALGDLDEIGRASCRERVFDRV